MALCLIRACTAISGQDLYIQGTVLTPDLTPYHAQWYIFTTIFMLFSKYILPHRREIANILREERVAALLAPANSMKYCITCTASDRDIGCGEKHPLRHGLRLLSSHIL